MANAPSQKPDLPDNWRLAETSDGFRVYERTDTNHVIDVSRARSYPIQYMLIDMRGTYPEVLDHSEGGRDDESRFVTGLCRRSNEQLPPDYGPMDPPDPIPGTQHLGEANTINPELPDNWRLLDTYDGKRVYRRTNADHLITVSQAYMGILVCTLFDMSGGRPRTIYHRDGSRSREAQYVKELARTSNDTLPSEYL